MAKKQETLCLVAVKEGAAYKEGVNPRILKEGLAPILTIEGKKLKKETQWKGYYFQLRYKSSLKAKPIWPEGRKL